MVIIIHLEYGYTPHALLYIRRECGKVGSVLVEVRQGRLPFLHRLAVDASTQLALFHDPRIYLQ